MTLKYAHNNKTQKNPSPKHERGIEMLKDFGLTNNEAVIYTYLLEQGKQIGGSKIALGTSLHRQYVYLGINKLIDLGLVETIQHGKNNKYKAVAPSQIEKIAKRRVIQAEDIARELNTFSTIGHEQDFEVVQGTRAIARHEIDYFTRKEEREESEYIIGGNEQGFEQLMGDLLDEYISTKDKKGIKVFYIGSNEEESRRYKDQKLFTARTLKGLPRGFIHTVIRKDEVLFFSFLNPPLLYILKSPIVAENYKHFFEMLWNISDSSMKEIQPPSL